MKNFYEPKKNGHTGAIAYITNNSIQNKLQKLTAFAQLSNSASDGGV